MGYALKAGQVRKRKRVVCCSVEREREEVNQIERDFRAPMPNSKNSLMEFFSDSGI